MGQVAFNPLCSQCVEEEISPEKQEEQSKAGVFSSPVYVLVRQESPDTIIGGGIGPHRSSCVSYYYWYEVNSCAEANYLEHAVWKTFGSTDDDQCRGSEIMVTTRRKPDGFNGHSHNNVIYRYEIEGGWNIPRSIEIQLPLEQATDWRYIPPRPDWDNPDRDICDTSWSKPPQQGLPYA
jgi:hypothetical protein